MSKKDVNSTNYAEGRVFTFEDETAIQPKFLEIFPYEGPRQRVLYDNPEFSAVCPFSGLPDYGTIRVEYMPNEHLVELKSLKYYYLSFRNVGIFQEAITARVYKDLWGLLNPEWLKVTTIYNTRGGIDTTCVVDSKDQVIKPQ